MGRRGRLLIAIVVTLGVTAGLAVAGSGIHPPSVDQAVGGGAAQRDRDR